MGKGCDGLRLETNTSANFHTEAQWAVCLEKLRGLHKTLGFPYPLRTLKTVYCIAGPEQVGPNLHCVQHQPFRILDAIMGSPDPLLVSKIPFGLLILILLG